jgi:hypothetical protein
MSSDTDLNLLLRACRESKLSLDALVSLPCAHIIEFARRHGITHLQLRGILVTLMSRLADLHERDSMPTVTGPRHHGHSLH